MDTKMMRKHFAESLYKTLDGIVSPTPYLEITDGGRIGVRFLNGAGRLPSKDSMEVTILDLEVASLFFDDFHILFEGVTGVGKTYTSDALFDAVFGPEGHYTIRLSGGVLGSSALEPFTMTELEQGVPKTRIDHEKCGRYGALFIDEINRGDSQEVFQVVDGIINLNGDTARLGVPIPGTERLKGLAIVAAMNPADADHSSALELDIAGENRFLKFRYPNGAVEAASGQQDDSSASDLHERFWSEFRRRTGLKGGWRELYPAIADSAALPSEIDGETREFIDVALGYVGENPLDTFARNEELMKQADVRPLFSVRKDNNLKQVTDAQGELKHGFVRRDIRKIRNLSRLLSLIRGMKDGTHESSVGLTDAAVSIGVVLESKRVTGSEHGSLMTLVNDALSSYKELRKDYFPEGTAERMAGHGIRDAAWQSAVYAGQEHGFEGYLNTLDETIARLNTQAQGPARATILSRLVADLAVLRHFSEAHKEEIAAALEEPEDRAFDALVAVYEKSKSESSVYEHRLGSVIR